MNAPKPPWSHLPTVISHQAPVGTLVLSLVVQWRAMARRVGSLKHAQPRHSLQPPPVTIIME